MTHTGEEWFLWGWQQYAMIILVLGLYSVLALTNRLPSMDGFRRFADTINSSGGHILILLSLTLYAIKITMQLFYHVMGLPDEAFTKVQSMVTMATSFATGTLVGLPLGALLKTMNGGWSMPKGSDSTSISSITSTQTSPAPAAAAPDAPALTAGDPPAVK